MIPVNHLKVFSRASSKIVAAVVTLLPFNKSKHLSEIVLELPGGRAAVHEKRKAFSGSFAKTIKHLSVEFEEEEKRDEKNLTDCCKMNEYLLKMTPESSYDLSEGPFIPNRTAWPTRKVDSKVDLTDSNATQDHDCDSLSKPYCQKPQKGVDSKGRRQSFLWTPDAVDEGMYSTYLSQKIVFTKEYPYAKAIQVLMRKDHLNLTEEPKEMKKPKWRMQIFAFICCPLLGLLAILHNFRAVSAFNNQNVKSQRDNMRFSKWFSVFAILLGSIAWSVLFILRKHATAKKDDLDFSGDFVFESSNTTSSSS